ncbi:hypothetical protein EST38_g10634 [Candolleomyces aberdarensis]|uniref:Nephrocystin 3-like N-terminal domain-containing protein n=1 Tax=Candolleomyces aberdarensis TaxID=2316362 RepID=A0A4Q2D6X3_9AGAR|nr:hypothetical protein EST38_g10634 [Candolleomyces aberdarensis]
MADPPLHFEIFPGAHGFQLGQQTINVIAGNQYLSNGGGGLTGRLNPILNASHTRDRKTSPPDSLCFPGTREVITEITTWADEVDSAPQIVDALVSAVSLKIADILEESGRLLASYFFFRNAGERSTMKKFAATLATQMASVFPATAPFIDAALNANLGILNDCVSLTRQLERLVYKPFQSAVNKVPTKGPFIIVIDGLDECEDKRGVEEFIDQMLDFFEEYPDIPLRIFVASRVEQHIRERLETDMVRLGNLDSHSARKDIERFLQVSFQTAAKRDRVIRAYVRARGPWPTQSNMNKLMDHIDGSFVLASTTFKYIVQPATEEDPTTPMDRLPLTLEMNGLDGLYAQVLARSQHLAHFHEIMSTIALLERPLPIVGIAGLLGIEAFEVIRVLMNLQAIIHVPGTDEEGKVTLCHTSLRDFLTTESRSGCFSVPPSFHLHLSYCSFSLIFQPGPRSSGILDYEWRAEWLAFAKSEACDFINEIGAAINGHVAPKGPNRLIRTPPTEEQHCR